MREFQLSKTRILECGECHVIWNWIKTQIARLQHTHRRYVTTAADLPIPTSSKTRGYHMHTCAGARVQVAKA
jgi:hypothetical protein